MDGRALQQGTHQFVRIPGDGLRPARELQSPFNNATLTAVGLGRTMGDIPR